MFKPVHILALSIFLLSSPISIAKDDDHGGDGFRETAVEYDNKAAKYRKKGKTDISRAYARMADIKREAGALADQGRWDDIDWSEYHALEEKIHGMKHKKYK